MNAAAELLTGFPHAPGVEKDVLSVLFNDPAKLDEVPNLTAAHFYLPANRIVFDLIQELTNNGQPVELVSFVQYLSERGVLERAGGPSEVCATAGHSVGAAYLETHLGILTGHLARRMTIEAAEQMRRVAFDCGDVAEIIAATSAPISAIHDTLTATAAPKDTRAILLSCVQSFEARCTGQASPMGIETSLPELNRLFNGLHRKQTIVVSGYPGSGKTVLACQLATDAALAGHNTLICSLEMPAESLMDRILAYVARLPGLAITDPRRHAQETYGTDSPTQGTLKAYKTAMQSVHASPLGIEDLTAANVYRIGACIRRAHRKNPLAVVVVDYAQRIRPAPEKARESKEQQLSHASNHLADLSKELGFCLLFPSQLNKEGAAKHAEAINEDADLHLQISQNRSGPNPTFEHIGLVVVKDRHHGKDGQMLPVILDAARLRFISKPFPQ